MKKILVFLTIAMASNFAQAQNILFATFGSDGASLESMPTPESAAQAAAIYKVLSVKAGGNGDKTVSTTNGEFNCEKPKNGIHTKTAGCELAIAADSVTSKSSSDVNFNGPIANEIYNALKVEENKLPGGNTKSVGNLSCSVAFGSRMVKTYSCQISDVFIIQL